MFLIIGGWSGLTMLCGVRWFDKDLALQAKAASNALNFGVM
jgi:hypothetical protein